VRRSNRFVSTMISLKLRFLIFWGLLGVFATDSSLSFSVGGSSHNLLAISLSIFPVNQRPTTQTADRSTQKPPRGQRRFILCEQIL
jgi:hypothetical protein